MPTNLISQPSKALHTIGFTIVLIACYLWSFASQAQCAMCRASLESTGNKTKVEAVNDGIVFLMAIPYILVAIIGFVIYRMYYKKHSEA